MSVVFGVLAASLLGSVHCAAMCGAFTCLYAPAGGRKAPHLAYHGGRMLSYVTLGGIGGALGSRVDVAGEQAGVAHLAAMVAGILMMLWAASVIAAESGIHLPVTLAPEWAKRLLGRALVASRERSAATRALLLGLVTTLLPCGWLYTFVVVAAGTGSAPRGAAVMFTFWLGTLPILLAVGAGASRVFGSFARRLPLVSAAVVLVLGMLSVAGKLHAPTSGSPHSHMEMAHDGR